MKINLKKVSVRDVVKNYRNDLEDGVVGFDGKLNIRPKYQREFVYNEKQQAEVIRTIMKGFPLNTMYWASSREGGFELLDGQQRTISICEYVSGAFSVCFVEKTPQYFHNLTQLEKDKILDYELMIYQCDGDDKDKLDWFRVVNIAGVKLSEQELRNAVYTGSWLTSAKRWFSKRQGPAYEIGKKYLKGAPERQDYLETVIDWISDGEIESYMSEHQGDNDADGLWDYFKSVIEWVEMVFPKYRKEMKGIDWGKLYNQYNSFIFDSREFEEKIVKLMMDIDVTKKSGIYYYLFNTEEKHLSIRSFTDNDKRIMYEHQDGVCVKCENKFSIEAMEADHIQPWSQGGKTTVENCQMLCRPCNRKKSDK
jgi:hypothetical protein